MLGLLVSTPITEEQRTERGAMKRQAQLQCEEAAKYISYGKFQYFIEKKKKEMCNFQYSGYAIEDPLRFFKSGSLG